MNKEEKDYRDKYIYYVSKYNLKDFDLYLKGIIDGELQERERIELFLERKEKFAKEYLINENRAFHRGVIWLFEEIKNFIEKEGELKKEVEE